MYEVNIMVDINVGQIAEALNEKMDRNLANTDAIGQAILDGKVEVEALLEHNGYAKFTWKNGNKISNLLIQWGFIENVPQNVWSVYSLPLASKLHTLVASGLNSDIRVSRGTSTSELRFYCPNAVSNVEWFAIYTSKTQI